MLPAALYSVGDAGGIQGRFRSEPTLAATHDALQHAIFLPR
ncbi:hypothetical protein [Xanthomonas populi]|nr:hypothetical protein [Xanthomonas populi]